MAETQELFQEQLIPTPTLEELYSQLQEIRQTLYQPQIIGAEIESGAGTNSYQLNSQGLYLGGDTFASSPFSVTMGGAIKGTSGAIGGWSLASTTLTGGNTILSSAGIVTVGDTNDVAVLSSVDSTYRIWAGHALGASAPFSVTKEGVLSATGATISGSVTALSGRIANWFINTDTISSDAVEASSDVLIDSDNAILRLGPTSGNYIKLDGANLEMESSNYVSGPLGAGFHIDTDLAEFGNIRARGKISTSVFEKDSISAIGGQLIVANADILNVDMTAADNSTLTITGDTTFAVNDILIIGDGTEQEYFRVTNIGSAPTYTVTRDLAAAYGANVNPVWKKGTAVTVLGSSDGSSTYGGGWLYMKGAGTNASYYAVVIRTGVAYNAYTEYARFGNLNGFLDFVADEYGFGIGFGTDFISYTKSSGFRIGGSVCNFYDSDGIYSGGLEGDLSGKLVFDSRINTFNFGGNIEIEAGQEIRFYDTDDSNYVGFEAPALSADKIWVLPSADGAANDVIRTDGSGNLSFKNVGWTDGWVPTTITGTYSSWDDTYNTGVWTVAGDYTATFKQGLKVKFTQATGGVKYAWVTKDSTYSNPNTTVTMFLGSDGDVGNLYVLEDEDLTAIYYSVAKNPIGFPVGYAPWTIKVTDTANRTTATPTATTWYNVTQLNISVPIGTWMISYEVVAGVYDTTYAGSGGIDIQVTLSTANNTQSHADISGSNLVTAAGDSAGDMYSYQTITRSKEFTLTSGATKYMNIRTNSAGLGGVGIMSGYGYGTVKAVIAYL